MQQEKTDPWVGRMCAVTMIAGMGLAVVAGLGLSEFSQTGKISEPQVIKTIKNRLAALAPRP